MKIVDAQITVELGCICPHCEAVLDYYDYIANHKCLNVFDNVGQIFEVNCPECRQEFEIEINN